MANEGPNSESLIRARAWITPKQFEQLIGVIAALELQRSYLQLRDELLFQYMYDLGLRVSEAPALTVAHRWIREHVVDVDAEPVGQSDLSQFGGETA